MLPPGRMIYPNMHHPGSTNSYRYTFATRMRSGIYPDTPPGTDCRDRQHVGIARTLDMEPKILLMDDWTLTPN